MTLPTSKAACFGASSGSSIRFALSAVAPAHFHCLPPLCFDWTNRWPKSICTHACFTYAPTLAEWGVTRHVSVAAQTAISPGGCTDTCDCNTGGYVPVVPPVTASCDVSPASPQCYVNLVPMACVDGWGVNIGMTFTLQSDASVAVSGNLYNEQFDSGACGGSFHNINPTLGINGVIQADATATPATFNSENWYDCPHWWCIGQCNYFQNTQLTFVNELEP